MDWIALLNRTSRILGKFGQGGWRPYWGWGLGSILLLAIKFALYDAPLRGIALDSNYYNFLLGALGIFVATFITREVGKHLERQAQMPGGGLINPAATA